jgi:cytochrome P450
LLGLSRTELLHEILLFLIAGFETTSSALSWLIYHMSKHPRVQQKIKAELMNDNNEKQPLTVEHLDSLVYLDAVINEMFRFSPPADGTYRTLTVDDHLPESNVLLYKGEQVCISLSNVARDPRYWSIDPELFYPERFLGEDKSHHPYAFLPFGSGHRQCVGQDLARFELKVIAARLMQHITFGDGGPEVNTGEKMCNLTIRPKQVGVTITFD